MGRQGVSPPSRAHAHGMEVDMHARAWTWAWTWRAHARVRAHAHGMDVGIDVESSRTGAILSRSQPRESWARIGLGGKRIADGSNIIFSNGAYDPWSRGGVLKSPNPSMHAINVPSGAHHIDLMFSDPADPADVSAVRAHEMDIIHGWIEARRTERSLLR